MTRLKALPDKPITDLEEAEDAMAALCRVQAEIEIKQGQAKRRLLKLNQEAAEKTKPLMDQQAELVQRLTSFIEDHQGLLTKGAKSIKLTSGVLGMRSLQGKLEPLAKDKKAAQGVMARAVKLLGKEAPHCVKVTATIDLNALRAEGRETWERVGFGLVGAKDEPYVKPASKVVKDLVAQMSGRE